MQLRPINSEHLNFNLNEDTRKQGLYISNKVYSLHVLKDNTLVITDFDDYNKIYLVTTTDFYYQ